jgi:hypothetical protein
MFTAAVMCCHLRMLVNQIAGALQEVVGVVRTQLVGLLDGLKAGGLMEGHSWLEEASAAADEVGLTESIPPTAYVEIVSVHVP